MDILRQRDKLTIQPMTTSITLDTHEQVFEDVLKAQAHVLHDLTDLGINLQEFTYSKYR